jgi:hypothetical protein
MSDVIELFKETLGAYLPTNQAGNEYQTSVKLVELAKSLDPDWVRETLESMDDRWYLLVTDPQGFLDKSEEEFLQACLDFPWCLSEESLQSWYELDPESLKEIFKTNMETGQLLDIRAATNLWVGKYPEEFKAACLKEPIIALNEYYNEFKRVDPNRHGSALARMKRDSKWGTSLVQNTKRDHPEKLDELLQEELVSYILRKGEEKTQEPKDNLLDGWEIYTEQGIVQARAKKGKPPEEWGNYTASNSQRDRILQSRALYEAWAEIFPDDFGKLCRNAPVEMLEKHGDLWAEVDPEGYMKACVAKPQTMLHNSRTLQELSPKLHEALVNEQLQFTNPWSGGPLLDEAKLRGDWEKYKDTATTYTKITSCPKQQLEDDLEVSLDYLADPKTWMLPAQTLHEIIDAAASIDEGTFIKVLETLSGTVQGLHLRTDDLDTWKTLDYESWGKNSQKLLETQMRAARNSQTKSGIRRSKLTELANLLTYYKTRNEDVEKYIKNFDKVDVWLDLCPALLTKEQNQELVEHILETPPQSQEKVIFATLRASNMAPKPIGVNPKRAHGKKQQPPRMEP